MEDIIVATHVWSRVLFLEHHIFDFSGYMMTINLSTQRRTVIEALPMKENL